MTRNPLRLAVCVGVLLGPVALFAQTKYAPGEWKSTRGGTGTFQRGTGTYTYAVRPAGGASLVEERWLVSGLPSEAAQIYILSFNDADHMDLVFVAPVLGPPSTMTMRLVYRKIR